MSQVGSGGVLTSEGDIVVVLEPVDGIDLASNVELLYGLVEVYDSWVLWVTAEDLLGLLCPGGRVSRGVNGSRTAGRATYLSGW